MNTSLVCCLRVLCALLFVPRAVHAVGHWVQLNNPAPGGIAQAMLLSDGTVMAQIRTNASWIGREWCRLKPDARGSYGNGSWTNCAPMNISRGNYSSALLRDGRLFVIGGENTNPAEGDPAQGEIYDPTTNSWAILPLPPANLWNAGSDYFADSNCKMLPDGRILVAPVHYHVPNGTLIYDPTSASWAPGGTSIGGQDEASWVTLPDDSILTIDYNGNDSAATNSERYIFALNQWVQDANVPINIFSNNELGAAFLLPNGNALFLGGSGHTALYKPTGTAGKGTWSVGPNIPDGRATGDAPAAMMANGKILCAVSAYAQNGNSPVPTWFYEYDYSDLSSNSNGSFVATSSPGNTNIGSPYPDQTGNMAFLDLPDGTVLLMIQTQGGAGVFVYQPDGIPLAVGKPAIGSISQNPNGSYHLTGVGLNGVSAGAAFGDDIQMDSNYPLVRLTDSNGNVFYARTYNWSSSSVMTSCRTTSTEFAPPPGLAAGAYSLVVVVNGIGSDPVPFPTTFSRCTFCNVLSVPIPWPSVQTAYDNAPDCSTIRITAGTYHEAPMTFNQAKQVRLESAGGVVTIRK